MSRIPLNVGTSPYRSRDHSSPRPRREVDWEGALPLALAAVVVGARALAAARAPASLDAGATLCALIFLASACLLARTLRGR